MSLRRSAVVAAALLVLAGCTSSSSGDAPTWHADVKPLLEARCNNCHVKGGIAPFALDDFATARPLAGLIKTATANRTMPPWLAKQGCSTYRDDISLTAAQIAMLGRWSDAGAPEGSPSSAPATSPLTQATGLTRIDLTLPMPEAYAPKTTENDDYRCFLIDWPYATDTFVAGFRADPGNTRLVHHVIAFLVTPEKVARYEQLDADEAGPGYTCFGGPAPNERSADWLGAWAPGGLGNDGPAGTGIRVPPGSKVALQVHYNTANARPGDVDLTKISFKLEDHVDKEAFILPFTSPFWVGALGPSTMHIAAGDANAEQTFTADPSNYLKNISRGVLQNGESFAIHSAALHMHTLGTTASVSIIRKQTLADDCLLDLDHWDFSWQRSYEFETPKTFSAGDQLNLECHWDNSAAHQKPGSEPQDLTWGESTSDEMCLAILYVSKL